MIRMKDIIREGHDTLRAIAKPVSFPLSDEDKDTMDEIMGYLINSQDPTTMAEYDLRPGVGLAAPQINVSKRMIGIRLDEGDEVIEYPLFNPRIISHSEQMIYLEGSEGCLSIDYNVEEYVKRYARITVEAQDYDGKIVTIRARGYLSIVFQHEIDHLNGILFIDRLTTDVDDAKPL